MRPIDAYVANMELVEMYNNTCEPRTKEALRDAMQIIAKAPTVALPRKWIRVKDRLPKVDSRVLTLDKWGHIHDREFRKYMNGKTYFSPDGLEPGRDVTHWMPLPEPPKEDSHA